MTDQILNQARDRMRKSLDVTRNDLASIRSGRATPSLVENITVSCYGGTQKLKVLEMATITTQDSKTLLISPYDPSQIDELEKGIQQANTGLTPVIDGEVIRIAIPSLSQERRLEYIKLAKAKLEAGRIMIRQVRQEAMKDLKSTENKNTITEDERKHGEKLVQELTDEMIAEIDSLGEKKEQELLRV
jgi:ribosome recycling factor